MHKIAVVIPCYRVKAHILGVLELIGKECWRIYVVDDACPEQSGKQVEKESRDSRVTVLRHEMNLGVGGAMITGYRQAIADGADIIIKVDGDGQMDPRLIPRFAAPIQAGAADYVKGNRFYDLANLRGRPWVRILGYAALSFFSKISTGYWNLFDPTNGFTAIHARVAGKIPWAKISQGYFFESDLLFRLNTLRAVVADIPMDARYADEQSNLRVPSMISEFLWKHVRNSLKRVFYNYYLRNFSIASVELVLGLLLILFGVLFGGSHWLQSIQQGEIATAGTVMLAALPVLIGIQLLIAFLSYDMSTLPRTPIHKSLGAVEDTAQQEKS